MQNEPKISLGSQKGTFCDLLVSHGEGGNKKIIFTAGVHCYILNVRAEGVTIRFNARAQVAPW